MKKLAIIALSACSVLGSAGQYSNIYVFGDSLSDDGNVFLATGGTIPSPSFYFDGRFSNGPIWTDYMAQAEGVSITPVLGGGTDYAFGGAETGLGSSPDGTPNLGVQLEAFFSFKGSFAPHDLAVIWGGSNDFLDGATDPMAVAQNTLFELEGAAFLGAKNLLVPNLAPLGDAPDSVLGGQTVALNTLASEYNADLAALLQGYKAEHPDIVVRELDIAGLYAKIEANPGAYGFSNITDAYLYSGVGDPNNYLYWDGLHPTSHAQALIGQAMVDAVPGPSVLATIALQGVLVARRRRRRS